MLEIKLFSKQNKPRAREKEVIINFLYENLQEYGDPKPDIEKAISYSLEEVQSFGGFILVAYLQEKITGVVVINETGMQAYIPENILVYIATHKDHRGQGIGKALIQEAVIQTNGDIALHVEPDNPARFLYEKVGFESKYIEMRLKKVK